MEGIDVFLKKILEIRSLKKGRLNQERLDKRADIFFGETMAMTSS